MFEPRIHDQSSSNLEIAPHVASFIKTLPTAIRLLCIAQDCLPLRLNICTRVRLENVAISGCLSPYRMPKQGAKLLNREHGDRLKRRQPLLKGVFDYQKS